MCICLVKGIVSSEARRGHRLPLELELPFVVVMCPSRILENKLKSSVRASNVLNYWDVSSIFKCYWTIFLKCNGSGVGCLSHKNTWCQTQQPKLEPTGLKEIPHFSDLYWHCMACMYLQAHVWKHTHTYTLTQACINECNKKKLYKYPCPKIRGKKERRERGKQTALYWTITGIPREVWTPQRQACHRLFIKWVNWLPPWTSLCA